MTSLQTQRNSSIDIIKCIAAFLVVCIHYLPKSNMVDAYINAICRVAVPLFFIISGYYYDNLKRSNKLKLHIIKIIKITLWASLLYLIASVAKHMYKDDLLEWLLTTFSLKNLSHWLIFNDCPISIHLWYLYALIYALVANVIVDNLKIGKGLIYISMALLCLHLVLNIGYPCVYLRNWLLLGLPFIVIGRYLYRNEQKIRHWHITNRYIFVGIMISMILLFIEVFLLRKIGAIYKDIYLSIVICVLLIMVLAIRNPFWGRNTIVSYIGRLYSSDIYLYHMIIGGVLLSLVRIDLGIVKYIFPVIVFFITLVFILSLSSVKFTR